MTTLTVIVQVLGYTITCALIISSIACILEVRDRTKSVKSDTTLLSSLDVDDEATPVLENPEPLALYVHAEKLSMQTWESLDRRLEFLEGESSKIGMAFTVAGMVLATRSIEDPILMMAAVSVSLLTTLFAAVSAILARICRIFMFNPHLERDIWETVQDLRQPQDAPGGNTVFAISPSCLPRSHDIEISIETP
jgi:biopolymer transport protein ExbB/TolQ